jgi:acetyl esterase/lipase
MALRGLPHPDAVTGALSELLQWIAAPAANTLDALGTYRGLTPERFLPAPERLPEIRVTRRWSLPGLVSEDLVFESLHEPLDPVFGERYRADYALNHRVYARRVRPEGARGRPRLLYIHGYMQPETPVEELGLLASMALFLRSEIVQMQPPYHGRRTPRGSRFSGELYWTADLVRSFEALRQSILDARTLLSWMLEDDPRPVGVTGLSLGGFLSAALTCTEPRFSFSMPLIAHMDIAALVADAPVLGRMRRDLASFGWTHDDFRRFVESLGWYELRSQIPPDRILMLAASEDRFFDPKIVESLWKSWQEPEIHWYPTSHMGFVARLPSVVRRMRAFFDAQAARAPA